MQSIKLISLVLLGVFLISFNANATDVDGNITYKLPSGELVQRDVTLDVPSRGQGEVVLKGQNFEWKTTQFGSKTIAGEVIFWAAFKTEFRGNKSTILFKGTYLQGTNRLIYAGSFYKAKGHIPFQSLDAFIGFDYNGQFSFDYLR